MAQGIDPKAGKKGTASPSNITHTFGHIAREWHASNKRWSERHRQTVLRSLEQYIFPQIGKLDITTLRTSQLLAPIKAIDDEGKHNIAQRLQLQELLFELTEQQHRLKTLNKRLEQLNAQYEDIRRLLSLPGIGPLGASALMVALGNSQAFENGRHFASYLG